MGQSCFVLKCPRFDRLLYFYVAQFLQHVYNTFLLCPVLSGSPKQVSQTKRGACQGKS